MESVHMRWEKMTPFTARLLIGAISLIGLFSASYLLYTYATNTPIVCGFIHGCDIVRRSKWATSFGLPRPLFGLIFYFAIFASLIVRAATRWRAYGLRTWTRIAVLFGFVESGFLFLVQWLDIKAFCIWCLTSAVCATLIVILDQFDHGRLYNGFDPHESKKELQAYLVMMIAFLVLGIYGFSHLTGIPRLPF